jgi:hypothetical protein
MAQAKRPDATRAYPSTRPRVPREPPLLLVVYPRMLFQSAKELHRLQTARRLSGNVRSLRHRSDNQSGSSNRQIFNNAVTAPGSFRFRLAELRRLARDRFLDSRQGHRCGNGSRRVWRRFKCLSGRSTLAHINSLICSPFLPPLCGTFAVSFFYEVSHYQWEADICGLGMSNESENAVQYIPGEKRQVTEILKSEITSLVDRQQSAGRKAADAIMETLEVNRQARLTVKRSFQRINRYIGSSRSVLRAQPSDLIPAGAEVHEGVQALSTRSSRLRISKPTETPSRTAGARSSQS